MAVSVAGTPPVAGSPAVGGSPEFLGRVLRAFSPNGDGVKDRIRLPYELPKTSRVNLRVTRSGHTLFTVRLARRSAGRHVWIWNGRVPDGRTVPHGTYEIQLRTPHGRAETWVEVDLGFRARVDVAERFGRLGDEVPRVYPRSLAVRDTLGLEVVTFPQEIRRGVLTIRHRAGGIVARRSLSTLGEGRSMVWDARDGQDRPLPPGRYLAAVSGVDRVGNVGRSKPLRLWVSADRLMWRETTTVLAAQETETGTCSWSGATDCYDLHLCGTIEPSSPWIKDPYMADGQSRGPDYVRVPAGAYWAFWTEGDDAFDAASFTVDVRHLAPAD